MTAPAEGVAAPSSGRSSCPSSTIPAVDSIVTLRVRMAYLLITPPFPRKRESGGLGPFEFLSGEA